jgi:hypothetical protein
MSYEQLLCHLVGDYILQSHDMALNKTRSITWATYHGLAYSLPFAFIATAPAVIVICITHILIDRFAVARYVTRAKNYIFGSGNKKALTEEYPTNTPPYLSTWLVIILDNTLHLLINYFAVKYL